MYFGTSKEPKVMEQWRVLKMTLGKKLDRFWTSVEKIIERKDFPRKRKHEKSLFKF